MNNATLQLAVDASKMLILLGKGSIDSKEAGRIRARLDEVVFRLWVAGNDKSIARKVETLGLVGYVTQLHEALTKSMAYFNVASLVRVKPNYGLKNVLISNTVDIKEVRSIAAVLNTLTLPHSGDVFVRLEKNIRGEVLHKFNSIVRNDQWLTLLMMLNVPEAVKLNAELMAEYASNQGREQRAEKVAFFVTDVVGNTTNEVFEIKDLFITVSLSAKTLVLHKAVAPLFSALVSNPFNASVASALLAEATKPIEVAVMDVEFALNKKIDAFVLGLKQQQKTYKLEEAKRKRESVQKKEDAAVDALAGMRDHLQILAANPELLARALAQANLKGGNTTPAGKATVKSARK